MLLNGVCKKLKWNLVQTQITNYQTNSLKMSTEKNSSNNAAAMSANSDTCPICMDCMDNNINISITVCGHKFHSNCLLLCGAKCPMCRNNLIQNNKTLPIGKYTHTEYKRLMQEHGVSYDGLSSTTRIWLQDCEEHDALIADLNKKQKEKEEKKKMALLKSDPNKHRLFYGST
jgi:hypothetical protein